MNMLAFLRPPMATMAETPENHFLVVHPLDDAPEQKMDASRIGPMPMTPSVRFSLLALRGYLILMVLLVLYHVLDLAGLFGKH